MLNSFVVQLWSQMQDLDSSLSDAISSGSLFKAWTKHDLWRLFHVFLTRQGMYRHTFIVNHLEQAEDGGRWFLDKLRELSDTSEWPFKFIILSSPHECLEAALKDYEGMNLDLLIQGSAISGHRENGLMVEEQHVHVPLETENAESMPCNDIGMQDGATNYVRSPPGRATPPRAGWSTEKLILSRSKTDTAQAYLDSISEEWRAWTRDILHLVLFARRSLTPLELGDALSIRLKLNNNSTKTYPCSDLERSLGDYFKDILVIADDEVHFIHQSLRDCLTTSLTSSNDKWYSISPSDANREIFDLCFHCIGTRPHTQIDISFSGSSAVNYVIPPDRSAFQSYAAKHWPAHFNEVQADRHPLWSAQAVKKIMDLFEDMETFRWLSQHYWHTSNPFLRPDCSFLSPLPIASALGLCVVVTYMLERERQSSFFETDCGLALVEAARCGHMDVAMLLVKACVPSLPVLQESVLRAAYGDHETLAQYLFTQTKIRGPVQWSPEILQRVAYLGFAEMVKSLCESGPDIHIPIGRLTSPLYLAAVNNQVEVINLLLDHGADIEVADETGLTPLGGACLSGQDEAVRALLAHGARLDARDSSHNRPLEIASMLGFHKVVQTLINSGAELGPDRETPRPGLVSAAAYGFEKCVRELLDAGADPNREGPYGNALVYAVDDGKISLCKLLIERGAKVNGTNPKFPILNVGVTQDSIEMVRLLVESGADIEIEDDDGESPLTLAAGLESKTITEYLLDHGADVNHANKWGETALFIAARECRTETVRALLNVHDVDVNTARVKHSYAPIHSGVDSVEIIDMLLEKNANINAMSGSGTPLYLASKHDLKETVECLLSHGANTEIECDLVDDTLCRTALSIAVEFGNTSSIRLLLDAGANINKPMQDGVSALAAAMHIGNEDVLKMLLEYQPRLDAIDLRHNTALIMMKDSTPLSMVKRLVRRGANLEIANDFGITPLSRAIFLGRADIVRYLLLKHARVDVHLPNSGSLLHVACRSGNLEIVKMMTEHRLDVNEICDERGGTPLQSAFLGLWYKPVASQMEIIDFLVHEKKVDLNANGGFYGYALNVACAIAPAETINMLLEKGARLDVEDLMGRHPIHFASLRPLEFLLTLIRQNADISAMDRVDRTALHWAIIGGHVEVVRSLLEMSNIGVNSRDKDNWTPLLWALKNSGQWIFHQVTETKSEASTPGSKSDAESQRRKYNEAQEVMERLWVLHKPNKSGLHVGENGSAQEQIVRLLLSHGAKESVYGYFRGQRWSAVAIAMYHGASDRILGLIAPDPTYTSKKKTVHSSGYRIQHSARKAKKQDIWCDSCLLEVWGHWYHCNKCFDFDLCSKCYGCRSDLHPGHTFLEKGDEFDETSDEADELRGGIGVDQKTGEVSSLSDVGGEGVEELTGSMMKAIVNSDSVADEEKKI
ncbi:uncharacterized protein A1O5_07760 [Cladophialophora psammophila CBS 110553]|uniref:ZZ-type domain-containing protein n=1 Tax=Cladophialophora psammophila CBS 110553 TaxID=1182543 RepID=W9WLQ5_9EURO|nr:uncharacterized protein A1O5_07760 [Cladophialophora psammophila CBS 110553]EXJ68828.1 hypothetical protein A1O5_07760 [Cladophialophora psammophila CBS 110553]